MNHNFSIMNLNTAHLDEICEDIRQQYETGVSACPLFCMTLVPEGDPPVNKAAALCADYMRFKEKLDALGVPNGVLVQATIGHGWKLGAMFPYQPYVGVINGEAERTVCPYDEGFRGYIRDAMRTIAACHPDHIMVDDDFRLIGKAGGGCACPLHLARFNALAGTSFTREALNDALAAEEADGPYHRIFIETQREAITETARVMRDAIDEIDPTIPGSFCVVGNNAEFGAEVAKILAGAGNPVVLRLNNGHYAAAGTRFFTRDFFRAAAQVAKVRDEVDILLAETDTCPQNRYSTSASVLHTHFTGSILEGAAGAKHWITRLAGFEPKSGLAYRKILSRHSGFYDTLSRLVPTVRWRGCRMPVLKAPLFRIGKSFNFGEDYYTGWGECVFERLGIPMFFSGDMGGILCLDKKVLLSDDEILKALHGTLLLASDAAEELIRRGFSEYLGVDVREWTGKLFTSEHLLREDCVLSCQVQTKELVITDPAAQADSMVCNLVHGMEHLFPGSVVYKNKLGGTVITFAGTPKTKYNIAEAFSFLNETRKRQLIRLLSESGELPAYMPGDEELYFRAGDLPDGRLLLSVINLGFDVLEHIELHLSRTPRRITRLTPEGTEAEISFAAEGENWRLHTPGQVLDPVILFVEY
ncbi:MAG: hypothetical protein IKL89_01840 [Clostridia bacterium]|nr:hypothetical protein [Clostridia bacterium]